MPGHIWKSSQGNLAGLYLNDRWGSFLKYNILIREHAFADSGVGGRGDPEHRRGSVTYLFFNTSPLMLNI